MGYYDSKKIIYQCQFCGKDVKRLKKNLKKVTCFDCTKERQRLNSLKTYKENLIKKT